MSGATATAPSRRRSVGGWAAIAAGIIVVGLGLTAIAGIAQLPARGLLDPHAAGPDGTRAITRLLQKEGVSVVAVRDRAAARAALSSGGTLVWADTSPLADDTIREISSLAEDVVLLDPASRDLRVLLPGASVGGYGMSLVEPDCELPDAQRAGPITPGALFTADAPVQACYISDGGAGLVVRDEGERRVSAVDGTVLFTNAQLARDGNAALALNLLGRHPWVVWYLPSLEDSDFADSTPSLGELTPPWVTPVMLLLLTAGVAAAVWRGRRFGPLVTERLPVTVRVGETSEGRARLYARAGEPTHALDNLRIGALTRLARLVGLGPSASAQEISDAVAERLGEDRQAVRGLLLDTTVDDDAQLVEAADRVRSLEQRLHAAVRPAPPAQRPEPDTALEQPPSRKDHS